MKPPTIAELAMATRICPDNLRAGQRLLAGSKQKNGTQNQESRRFIRFAASLLTKI